jgi:hypothetical protein
LKRIDGWKIGNADHASLLFDLIAMILFYNPTCKSKLLVLDINSVAKLIAFRIFITGKDNF